MEGRVCEKGELPNVCSGESLSGTVALRLDSVTMLMMGGLLFHPEAGRDR